MYRTQGLEVVASKLILNTLINSSSTWALMGNQNASQANLPFPCNQITVGNATGVTLSFAYALSGTPTPVGETFEVPTGTSWSFRGISKSDQLLVRLASGSGSVTLKAVAEGC
jgi:hypothetical protein